MRVQESKPCGKLAIMGKKKHKLRKQAKENEQCASDSSDEGGSSGRCPHINKAININTMRKAVKQLAAVGVCTSCNSDNASTIKPAELITDDLLVAGATGGVSDIKDDLGMFEDLESTIWLCLQCGHQGCDRNSKDKHALKHYETPRSSCHALALNVSIWTVWCYMCDDEVSPDSSRKIQECIDFTKKMADTVNQSLTAVNKSAAPKAEDNMLESSTMEVLKIESKPAKPKPISLQAAASVSLGLPKVKGLNNLGNTCFFNAVMQNISQTYILDTLLSERGQKGAQLHLPGQKSLREDDESGFSSESSSSDDDDDLKNLDLNPVLVTVGDPGTLTLSLISFMRDMHNPAKSSTVCPNSLFGQVCKKAPRFKGFQQQDSHELLRHLLDGMKAEEIKRSQTAILKQFQLSENTNPKKVDEDTRAKVKAYGRQAKHTFVDEVFSGSFISTVQCEECHQPSQIYEQFLDISLPILEEKTVRPNSMWNWRKKDEPENDDKPTVNDDDDKGVSKHQMKKGKRQTMREAKRKPRVVQSSTTLTTSDKLIAQTSKSNANPDSRSQSDGEISDADIEDNIESDVSRSRLLKQTSQDDDEKVSLPVAPGGASSSVVDKLDIDRCDSAGRSEESTLTETSAGESNKAGCSSCNSIASLSDSTCKASSAPASPTASNIALNQVLPSQSNPIAELTETMQNMDISDKNSKSPQDNPRENPKSDQGSTLSLDNTEDFSMSNGNHRGSSHKSRSSGYSSTSASKASTCSQSKSQLRSQAKVRAMGTLAPRYQPISQECSIRSCLNQFTSCELLTGSNKFGCSVCTKRKHCNSTKEGKRDIVYTNASKQVLVFQPPAILTLHLKRFQQVGFTLRKVNRHVEFPMILDLAPYCSSLCKGVQAGQTKVLYALYGVVEHSGRLTGGHYTAYVKVRPHNTSLCNFVNKQETKNICLEQLVETLKRSQHCDAAEVDRSQGQAEISPPPGKWYYISDSRVLESSESAVLRCQAYLLFYERIF